MVTFLDLDSGGDVEDYDESAQGNEDKENERLYNSYEVDPNDVGERKRNQCRVRLYASCWLQLDGTHDFQAVYM